MAKAKAPRPGVGERKAAAEAAQRVLRITILGESRTLVPAAVTVAVKTQVKAATHMSFGQCVDGDTFDESSLAVMWWVAGMAGGKLKPWRQAAAEFDELMAQLDGPDDIEVTEITPDEDDDDPES